MTSLFELANYNQQFVNMTEHWDDFMAERVMSNPNIWHDRIQRGAYQLFSGTEHKMNIFRGGLPVAPGLDTWDPIATSIKAGDSGGPVDNCEIDDPQSYEIAIEQLSYTGYKDDWRSGVLCVNDLQYIDYAQDQVANTIGAGVDFGISMLENFNREMYLNYANSASRTMVMADGASNFEDDPNQRFKYYNYLASTDVAITDVDAVKTPYITFSTDLKISTLNFAYLDYLRVTMAERCGEAALSQDNGLPVFGLMVDIMDFERMVQADSKLHEEFLYADASALIAGYNLGMKYFRGWALINDKRQARFRPFRTVTAAEEAVTGSTLVEGDMIATRINPLRAGRSVTIGNVPEPNPDYYNAGLGIGVIFMNDVFMNLFVPSVNTLGSGTAFGPAPGLTGQWSWINIKDPVSNLLGEEGFFYGRFKIFPKPLLFSNDVTVFLYARCPMVQATACEINSDDDTVSGDTAVTVSEAVVTGDVNLTNRTVTLTFADTIDLSLNDDVTIDLDGAGDDLAAEVLDASDGPTYTFAWIEGAANEPAAYTEFISGTTTVIKV
jgi:hypothetical protein